MDLLAREILRENPPSISFPAMRRRDTEAVPRVGRATEGITEGTDCLEDRSDSGAAGHVGGRVADYADLALLRHECGKQKRHIPLRQLVKRAGNALAALKPCFMMGPMSVAQYLEPGKLEFDLVVMDEASQVKPEDALGLLREAAKWWW